MKLFSIFSLTTAMLTLCSCGNQTAKNAENTESAPANTITLNDGKTTMRWMKDNHGNKLMERSLFPEAPDSLIEALNLQEGIPVDERIPDAQRRRMDPVRRRPRRPSRR